MMFGRKKSFVSEHDPIILFVVPQSPTKANNELPKKRATNYAGHRDLAPLLVSTW